MELFTLIGFLVVALIIIACLENDNEFAAGLFSVLGTVYVAWTFGFVASFNYVLTHLPFVVTCVLGYLAAGTAWSFFKWDRFVAKRAKAGYDLPSWRDYTGKLTAWTIWFPFSMVGYVFGTFLRDAIAWIQEQFGALYDKIAKRHYPVNK